MFKKRILVILLCSASSHSWSQEISITKKTERIIVNTNGTFVRHVEVTTKNTGEHQAYPIFYDSELEKVSNIKVFSRKGKRFKLIEDVEVAEDDVKLDYIASKKIQSVSLPKDAPAKLTYSVECDELMYLANLPLFSNTKIDTLNYKVIVPQTFRFVHDVIYRDQLSHMAIDSTHTSEGIIWDIIVSPKRTEPDLLALFGIYKDKQAPLIRTIVIPDAFESDAKKYLNNWYLEKVKAKRGLNSNVVNRLDEITKGIYDHQKILEVIYDYVQHNFKYVAIEIGMGAFIPTHANEVFSNKEGDCKDLSNFLSEALNYKGIKSHVALAATYNHISDCDFPSLGSANHVVCLAFIDGRPIVLDPTDPIHVPNTPVQSIQNRTVLVVNDHGGDWFNIGKFDPDKNKIEYKIQLSEIPDQLTMRGTFDVTYQGISGNFLKRKYHNLTSDIINDLGGKHYESVFGEQTVTNSRVFSKRDSVGTTGNILVQGKTFSDTNDYFIFLDFLPRLFETINRDTPLEGTHLGSNFKKKVQLRIELDKNFDSFDPVEHTIQDDKVSLSLRIHALGNQIIECVYEFMVDYDRVDSENLAGIKEVLEFFNKRINEPIVLRKKT